MKLMHESVAFSVIPRSREAAVGDPVNAGAEIIMGFSLYRVPLSRG